MAYGKLAKHIRKTASLRENSWDVNKSEYTISMYDAALTVTKDAHKAEIVYSILVNSWNESIYWAQAE